MVTKHSLLYSMVIEIVTVPTLWMHSSRNRQNARKGLWNDCCYWGNNISVTNSLQFWWTTTVQWTKISGENISASTNYHCYIFSIFFYLYKGILEYLLVWYNLTYTNRLFFWVIVFTSPKIVYTTSFYLGKWGGDRVKNILSDFRVFYNNMIWRTSWFILGKCYLRR